MEKAYMDLMRKESSENDLRITPPTLQSKYAFIIEEFRLKSCMGVQYMRIELKHFQRSKNRGLIAAIEPSPKKGLASFAWFIGYTCSSV